MGIFQKIIIFAITVMATPTFLIGANASNKKKQPVSTPAPMTPAEKSKNEISKIKTTSFSKIDSHLGRIDQMADALELTLNQAKETSQDSRASHEQRQEAVVLMDQSQSAFSVAKAAQGAGYAIRQKTVVFFNEIENLPFDVGNPPDMKKLTQTANSFVASTASHYDKVKNEIKKQKLNLSLIR